MTAQDVREGRCPSWCTEYAKAEHVADVARTDGPAATHMGDASDIEASTSPAGWQPQDPDKLTVYPSVGWDLKRGPLTFVNVSTNDCTAVTLTPAEARHLAILLIEEAATAERWE